MSRQKKILSRYGYSKKISNVSEVLRIKKILERASLGEKFFEYKRVANTLIYFDLKEDLLEFAERINLRKKKKEYDQSMETHIAEINLTLALIYKSTSQYSKYVESVADLTKHSDTGYSAYLVSKLTNNPLEIANFLLDPTSEFKYSLDNVKICFSLNSESLPSCYYYALKLFLQMNDLKKAQEAYNKLVNLAKENKNCSVLLNFGKVLINEPSEQSDIYYDFAKKIISSSTSFSISNPDPIESFSTMNTMLCVARQFLYEETNPITLFKILVDLEYQYQTISSQLKSQLHESSTYQLVGKESASNISKMARLTHNENKDLLVEAANLCLRSNLYFDSAILYNLSNSFENSALALSLFYQKASTEEFFEKILLTYPSFDLANVQKFLNDPILGLITSFYMSDHSTFNRILNTLLSSSTIKDILYAAEFCQRNGLNVLTSDLLKKAQKLNLSDSKNPQYKSFSRDIERITKKIKLPMLIQL